MDDFLMKLYNDELEKNAGAGQKQLFDALPISDLEAYLGIEKVAVGGPVEPEVSPAFRKAFQARETKGKEAQREAIKEHSSSDTQVERNIAPLKAGETIPERNITPHHPQISASAKSLPDRDYASQGETKQAAYEWADQMGRGLAHMVKKAAEEGVAEWAQDPEIEKKVNAAIKKNKAELARGSAPAAVKKSLWQRIPRAAKIGVPAAALAAGLGTALYAKHRKDKKKESCMMGKAGAAMMGVKLAHQIPEEMMPALIETTASQMVKEAKLPRALLNVVGGNRGMSYYPKDVAPALRSRIESHLAGRSMAIDPSEASLRWGRASRKLSRKGIFPSRG